jgi:putative flippase GtrA
MSAARSDRRQLATQFVKFGIVGISNTLLTLAVYTLLLKVLGVWYVAASAIGFLVGAVNGFLWNRRWTFREHVGDTLTPVRWFVVQGCGLLLDLLLIYLFVEHAGLDKLLGQACATAVVTVLTFFANRTWTFRVRPAAQAASGQAPAAQAASGQASPAQSPAARTPAERRAERAL